MLFDKWLAHAEDFFLDKAKRLRHPRSHPSNAGQAPNPSATDIVASQTKSKGKARATKQAALAPARQPGGISIRATLARIYLTLAAGILFNFFSSSIVYWTPIIYPTSMTPLLTPMFPAFLPWLNTWWFLGFNLNLTQLASQRWTPFMRVAELALDLFGAVILGVMAARVGDIVRPGMTRGALVALVIAGILLLTGALIQALALLPKRALPAPAQAAVTGPEAGAR